MGTVGKSAVSLVLLFVAVLAGFVLGRREAPQRAASEAPQRAVSGKFLYDRHCASCHGLEGRGDGPAAEALQQPTPDLTGLQARLSEAYSLGEIMRAIDGQRTIRAHGTSAMPVWGHFFEESLKDEPHTQRVTLLHVRALADYVHTLQASPTPR